MRRKPGIPLVIEDEEEDAKLHISNRSFRNTTLLTRINFVCLVGLFIWVGVVSSLHWERSQHNALAKEREYYGFVLPTDSVGKEARFPPDTGIIESCHGVKSYHVCCDTRAGVTVCGDVAVRVVLQRRVANSLDVYALVTVQAQQWDGAMCRLYCNV